MEYARWKTILLALILAMTSGGAWLYGQAPQAQILGSVVDGTGAAVPGATVILKNEATGVQNTAVTTSAGDYTFVYLDPGTYTVTVQKEGFETRVFAGNRVQMLEKRRVDVQLKVGQVSTKVEVTATAARVDTDSAAVAATVTEREVTDLPLNGREFSEMAVLMPGVQAVGTSGASGITAGASFATTLRISGGTGGTGTGGGSNAYTYDGVDNAWTLIGGPGLNPSVDSIEEFRIDRSQMQAEFGRGNNEIEVVTKGGTNRFHGTLWEYNRNSAVEAGVYYTHLRSPLNRNQFGGNIGGPIKKDKVFFFFNYEGQKLVSSSQGLGTELTAKQRTGDMSEFLALNPTLYQIHDPFTLAPYAGNIIPSSDLNPVSMAFVNTYMPLPNLPGTGPTQINNYLSHFAVTDNWHQGVARVDYNLSSKDRFYLRFAGEPRNPLAAGLSVESEPTTVVSYYFNTALAWQRNWTSNTLTEVRVGYHGEKEIQEDVPRKVWASPNTVGMGDTVPGYITMTPYGTGMSSWWFPSDYYFQSWDMVANLTHIHGAHTMKFGFEYGTHAWNNPGGPGSNKMYFGFNGQYTGIGISDFLEGWPYVSNTEGYGTFIPRANTGNPWTDFYAQDDWKVTPRLTLNLGLRWDLLTPRAERQNILSEFNPANGQIVVAGNKLLPAYTNQALVAANPGMFTTAAAMGWPLASMIDEQKTNFSPRFGFAYRPWRGNKTVIRGGYGMFYAPVNDFAMERNMVGSPYQQSAYSVVNTLPSPTVTIQNPYAGVSGTNSLPTAYYWPVNLKNEYMQQFNLGMQHELLWGLIAEGNLEHQHTIRLDNGINFNQSQLGVSSGYPYPNLQTSTTGDVYNAWNRYDALELILRKTGRNYNFMLSNVWAKEISGAPMIYVGTLFPGPGNYLPDELKLNFVVDVPMGKGRTFLNHGGVVDAVLGGWETGSIFILHQGGDPLTIGTSVNYTLDNQRDTGRPNRVCSGRLSNPTPAQWFNQSCFVAPTAPSWGNAGTGILFGPGRSMIGDWSVYKNFSMPEEMKLQFRTEFFNVFNHPYWNDPGTTMPATGVFGVITAKSLNPRTVQFALRLSF